jgi:RimJ/RimL family protein N-acetyltransferase
MLSVPTASKYRVELRELREADIDDRYLAWFSQDDSHLAYYSSSGKKFGRDTILKELRDGKESRRIFFYAIVDKASGLVIGNVKIGPIEPIHRTSDLVVLIGDRAFLGKGLAKEAIEIGNEIAFRDHDIRKLCGGMFADHIASIKAYLAAGWVVEGTLKGHYLVDGQPMDRILVACFSKRYFPTS